MRKRKDKSNVGNLHFRSVVKYIIWFYVLVVFAELGISCFSVVKTMKKEADFVLESTKSQIDYRVGGTTSLLSALANETTFMTNETSYVEKAAELEKYSDSLNYFLICIADKEFNVWDTEGSDANLASRPYMQKLLATGEPQVTDSFAAGADGRTMNFTVAVPILKNGIFDGCIFGSIYFDEIQNRLYSNIFDDYQELYLFGSENQVMANSKSDQYGKSYKELMSKDMIFSTTVREVEENMYNKVAGSNWSLGDGNLQYMAYVPIEGTEWTLACALKFWGTLGQLLPQIAGMIIASSLACMLLLFLANRHIESQMETVEMLITSVQDLEKKIYQNEKPDNLDFKEIISLTSKGLTDGLTGVITRSVFLNQIPFKIKTLEKGELGAICFVDMDNLKTLNDRYGHEVGDAALKNVGYVLREFEKKYDGLVGRYGGDEFILLLTSFTTTEELNNVVEELVERLHSELYVQEVAVPTQCSVGVTICTNQNEDVDALIKQADDMLYVVKQNNKGGYKIYEF